MNQLDLFYWAYEHYKKEFIDNRDDYLFKKGVNSKKAPNDYVSMIEIVCDIEEDWIAAIEKGLEYIAKAIKEDRQFIRNEGEVLPIEKIRRVSKDSIQDLSKHSNYITRLPEEEEDNVIPEKLLMIKRENDYSIYENRVVYTTLSYLKDFVASRLEKIKELVNKYDGQVQIKKNIELGYRSVDVVLNVHDIRKNDEIAMRKNSCWNKIERLDAILNGVLVLLKTPLMQEVSKAPLVSRPVTKTNVLKMNTNFKETLAVFDYVCAYNKPGYTISEREKKIAPLSIEQENSFTDIILLSSFLTYAYNNELEEELAKNYALEEKRRIKLQEDELLKKLEELRERVRKSGKSIEEYMLVLEEGYKVLEKRIEEAKEELAKTIEEYEQKIVEINEAHEQEIQKIEQAHMEEIRDINEQHEAEKQEIISKHSEEIAALRESIDAQYKAVLESRDAEIAKLQESNKKYEEEAKTATAFAQQTKEDCDKQIKEFQAQLDVANAELLAIRCIKGKPPVDPSKYAPKDRFNVLERELNALKDFTERVWKEAKKNIKKQYYSEIKK